MTKRSTATFIVGFFLFLALIPLLHVADRAAEEDWKRDCSEVGGKVITSMDGSKPQCQMPGKLPRR